MYHRNYTTYLQKELDFLKLLVTRFHEQEKINDLELDIALLKTQEIYEQLLRIKSMPEAATGERKAAPIPAEVPAAAVSEKKIPEPELQPEPPRKEPSEPPPAPLIREEKRPPVTTDAEPAKAGILAEKIGPTDFHPINETLAQQKPGYDLSSKLQTAPLRSIVEGIGLNDKFLYIRELFKGDSALYNNTVRHLDTTESLDDAMDFIHRHFDWNRKDGTVQKFINLVQRRHH
ncbi:MAG: hypothetical protein LBL04_11780 [Bacteroidales bacterium]|jgi:hypothetical protein|nr:hypothetical protein [Bacteroidales bacterium]